MTATARSADTSNPAYCGKKLKTAVGEPLRQCLLPPHDRHTRCTDRVKLDRLDGDLVPVKSCECWMAPMPHSHVEYAGWTRLPDAEDGTPIYIDLTVSGKDYEAATRVPRSTGTEAALASPDVERKSLVIVADAQAALLDRWRAAKKRESDARAEAAELREQILHLVSDDKTPRLLAARGLESLTLTMFGSPVAVLRWVRTKRFDKAAAARENPELIEKHTRMSNPEPRLELSE